MKRLLLLPAFFACTLSIFTTLGNTVEAGAFPLGKNAPAVPLRFKITELVQLDRDFDSDSPPLTPIPPSLGDFFIRLKFNNAPPPGGPVLVSVSDNFEDRCKETTLGKASNRSVLFTEGGPVENCQNAPWVFDFTPLAGPLVSLGSFSIEIDVIDNDNGPEFDEGDIADLSPENGTSLLFKVPLDGRWEGTFDWPQRCNYGPDRLWPDLTQAEKDNLPVGDKAVRICWEIMPDTDGDGLLDAWETDGFDADGDGVIDVDLPAMGADPMHKDLFIEIDWESSLEPVKEKITEVKAAFAAAPVDAGGIPNPDGLPGINLRVDTGGLTDSDGELVGDLVFKGNLGQGSEIEDGPWVFLNFCTGGLDDAERCSNDDDCDLTTPGDGNGLCENGFYRAKEQYFDANRNMIFRYIIMNTGAGGGQGRIGGNDIWLGTTASETLMHEIGHTLNLSHGGDRSEHNKRNCEPNYISIMNYWYPRLMRTTGGTHIDFSPALLSDGTRAAAPLPDGVLTLGILKEDMLDETQVLDPSDQEHLINFVGPPAFCVPLCSGGPSDGARCFSDEDCEDEQNPSMSGTCPGLDKRLSPCTEDSACGGARCSGARKTVAVGMPIDWNQDNNIDSSIPAQNIDAYYFEGVCGNESFAATADEVLTGYNDWANIRLGFWPYGDPANAPLPVEPELTEEQIRESIEEVYTTDLEVVKLGTEGPVEAETTVKLEYQLVISNAGPGVGGLVSVRDDLPSGFTVVALDDRCTELMEGVVTCNVESLLTGEDTQLDIDIEGVPRCQGGVPVSLNNVAAVENQSEYAGADPDHLNNSDMLATVVVDTTPPDIQCNAPLTIKPSDTPVSFTATAADSCDNAIIIPEVTTSKCFTQTKKGKRIDKDTSCITIFEGDTFVITDSGGVGGQLQWTVSATDVSGNVAEVTCEIHVVNPGQ